MAKPARTPSLTHRINFGLIVGSVLLMLLVVGGATGLVLNSKIQDSRSQAAVVRVAKMTVSPRRTRQDGFGTQEIGIDASRLKSGSVVTNFKGVLAVPRISVMREEGNNSNTPISDDPNFVVRVTGDSGTQSSPPNSGNANQNNKPRVPQKLCNSDKDCDRGDICYHTPGPTCVKGQPCPLIGVPAPYCRPQPRPTAVLSQPPEPDLLAISQDKILRVWGANNFQEVKNLNVSIETTDEMYLITVSGSTDKNNQAIQSTFAKNLPFLTVVLKDESLRWSEATLKGVSIRGFVPGISTEIELTGGDYPIPSVVPSSVPTISCLSDKECATGQYCYQSTPPCKPGTVCRIVKTKGYCKQLTTCGGIQGLSCPTGYSCRLTDKHSDSTGLCYPNPTPKTQPITSCFSNRDCKASEKCLQPPLPTCKPGGACPDIMPAGKCVSLPD